MLLSDRFTEALAWAHQLHQHQQRKASAVPYVAHLLGVASLVLEYGGDEDQAIAALLHDAIEDQGGQGTYDRIGARFGPQVAAMVADCSDSYGDPKPPWRSRKEAYIANLPTKSPRVWLVVTADKTYNAYTVLKDYRAIGDRVWDRFTGKKEGSLWYFTAIHQQLQTLFPHPLVAELGRILILLREGEPGGKLPLELSETMGSQDVV